jgi:UDP-GlcNAc:undecaprenyl-phosphate GlcNAc-1-phosphate transferase
VTAGAQTIGAWFLAAGLLAFALTAGLRRLLLRVGWVDYPRQDRWHRRPVARPGGAALFLPWILLLALRYPELFRPPLLVPVVGGAVVFLVGMVDDLMRLTTRPKLLLLIVAACLPPLFGLRFELFPPAVGVPLTILWVLGITNAFNWLDNIDGLAAGTAAIAALVRLVHFILGGEPVLATVAA